MFFTKKKPLKETFGLVTTGIGLGVGSQVLGDLGATHAQTAVGRVSKALPAVGSIYGAGLVLDTLDAFGKKIIKKRY